MKINAIFCLPLILALTVGWLTDDLRLHREIQSNKSSWEVSNQILDQAFQNEITSQQAVEDDLIRENNRLTDGLQKLISYDNKHDAELISQYSSNTVMHRPGLVNLEDSQSQPLKDQEILNQSLLEKLSDQVTDLSQKLTLIDLAFRNSEVLTEPKSGSMFHDYTIRTPGKSDVDATVIDNNP